MDVQINDQNDCRDIHNIQNSEENDQNVDQTSEKVKNGWMDVQAKGNTRSL